LDVFEDEPTGAQGEYSGDLKNLPNVYCTHHIGASTDQAQEAVASEVVRIVRDYFQGGTAPNVVNIKRAEVATHVLVVRHIDRVGVLAGVLGRLKDEGVNVQEMENIILGGAKAASAQISVDKAPSPEALHRIKMDDAVFDASVFPIRRDSAHPS
jgi:D-3-phosphoglycerate dehydrogenase